jgi:VCBS repeat-containing protein
MSERQTSARLARSLHQLAIRSRRAAHRAATVGLTAAFLVSIVGPAAVSANGESPAIGVDDVYSVAKNVALNESSDTGVLSNDYMSGHANLLTVPDDGFLNLSTNGAFSYEPNANFVGVDTFTYQACLVPNDCSSTPATVTITVSNTAPVATHDVLTVNEDSESTVVDPMDNDIDDNGDALRFAGIYQPLNGFVAVVGTGSSATLRYTPDSDFYGTDTFSYAVSDGALNSELGTVTVTVNGVNDAPSFQGGSDVNRVEDSGAYSATWATGISSGPGEDDGISFVVTNDYHEMFEEQPAISSGGVLTFRISANETGAAFVSVTIHDDGGINDGGATGNTATFTIRASAVNDAPTCSGATEYLDEDGSISGSLTDRCSDVDSGLTYSELEPSGEGALAIDPDGFWTYTPDADSSGSDSFTFEATDGDLTAWATIALVVAAINDAPTFSLSDDLTIDEDSAAQSVQDFLTNASAGPSDESGQTLTLNAMNSNNDLFSSQPAINLLTGDLTYTPEANANGVATVEVTLSDNGGTETVGDDNTTTHTFTITVTGVNDAPVGVADFYTIAEDGVLTVAVEDGFLANDTDVDGDTILFHSITNSINGTRVGGSLGGFTFTPTPNFVGTAGFYYRMKDSVNGTMSELVHVTITVTAVNDAPVAVDDAYWTDEDTMLSVDVGYGILANDTDEELDSLEVFEIVTDVSHGDLTLHEDGLFEYVPASGYNGTDSFTYQATDATGVSNTATVTITVSSINDPVTAVTDNLDVIEDTATSLPVLANDTDPDSDALRVTLVGGASHGTVSIPVGGLTVRYTPDAQWNGEDSFVYTVTDDHGTTSSATVFVNVSAVNDTPVCSIDDATLSVAEDGSLPIAFDCSDVEETTIEYGIGSDPSHGSISHFDSELGTFTYAPDLDYFGTDTLTVVGTDGVNGSAPITVTITVNAVNDAPVAAADAYDTDEDTAATGNILANDTDVDGPSLYPSLETEVAHGSLDLGTDGSFTYTPDLDWNGVDSFSYVANDGDLLSEIVTVTITVAAVNDAPVAVADTYTTDEDTTLVVDASGVLGNDTDADINDLTISYVNNIPVETLTAILVTDVDHGTLTLGENGSLSYVPTADFHGSDSFTYQANDGTVSGNTVTVTITVASANDAPVAVADVKTTDEDTATGGNVLTNDTDVEDDTLYAVLGTDVSHGTLALDIDGAYSYTPDANWYGTDSFTYQANDDDLDSNTVTVTITVTSVNDAPVAVADTYTTDEDTTLVVDASGVLANDTDVEMNNHVLGYVVNSPVEALSAILVTDVDHGTLTLGENGSLSYVPTADFHGSDSFTYKANDGDLDSGIVTVTITVASANDAPVAVADVKTTNEDTATSGNVLTNDTDVEDDTLYAVLGTDVSHGTLVLGSNGAFTYAPDANWYGTDSFTYQANDDDLDSNTATVTITVTSVNDAPLAVDDTGTLPENAAATFYNVLTNDIDIEHHALIVTHVSVGSPAGTVGIIGGRVRYTPRALFSGTAVITYTVSDQHGGVDATGSLIVSVTRDATAPVVTKPVVTIGEGSIAARIPVKVSWTASDAGVGVTEIKVQASMDGLAFTDLYTGVGTTTTASLLGGHSYRFRVLAIDAEGNASAYLTSDARALAVTVAASTSVTYAINAWNIFRPTGAHVYNYSSVLGNSASYTFTGREIVWVGPRSAKSGKANVYIDGVKVSTVDLYRATGFSGQQLYKKAFLSSGTHTIRIVVAEAGKWVSLDEFVVLK